MSPPRVVIIGCGFGGLWAAQTLARAPVELTVIDRTNHHLFTPLLLMLPLTGNAPIVGASAAVYGVMMGFVLEWPDAPVLIFPLPVPVKAKWLVIFVAAGSLNNYFGHDAWAPYAPGLKTLRDALEIRARILTAYERAERESDPVRRAAWLTFVVIGGGATGVELAGTLAEIARHTLRGEFRRFEPRNARIVLVEGSNRVLPPYPPDLSEKARRQLERLGVTVWLGKLVTAVDEGGVTLGAERLEARTVIWAAGVASSPLGRSLGAPLDRAGRVKVEPDLSLPGHAEVFVVGDLAAVDAVPGIAPAAKQMGRHAALNIRKTLEGKSRQAFRYRDYGQLATIGRNAAVAMLGRVHLSGYPAWLMWLVAHIYFLINFRNRLAVMIDWAWSYWTYQRYARIVIRGPT